VGNLVKGLLPRLVGLPKKIPEKFLGEQSLRTSLGQKDQPLETK